MPPDDEVRVRPLVEAASKAVSHAAGRGRTDLDDDELLRLALTKLVEIVGEAAKHVSNDLRESHPKVPWSAAARMRDRLVHHYFEINLDVLWSTVTNVVQRVTSRHTENEHQPGHSRGVTATTGALVSGKGVDGSGMQGDEQERLVEMRCEQMTSALHWHSVVRAPV